MSAIAAVAGGAAYVPDWGGYIDEVDARTGAEIELAPAGGWRAIQVTVIVCA